MPQDKDPLTLHTARIGGATAGNRGARTVLPQQRTTCKWLVKRAWSPAGHTQLVLLLSALAEMLTTKVWAGFGGAGIWPNDCRMKELASGLMCDCNYSIRLRGRGPFVPLYTSSR